MVCPCHKYHKYIKLYFHKYEERNKEVISDKKAFKIIILFDNTGKLFDMKIPIKNFINKSLLFTPYPLHILKSNDIHEEESKYDSNQVGSEHVTLANVSTRFFSRRIHN